MARREIINSFTYRGYDIQLKPKGSIKAILDNIISSLEYMWDTCNQNLCVIHFFVQLKDVTIKKSNEYIRGVLNSFKKTMNYNKIKSEFIWVRERGKRNGKYPHYHIALIVDRKYKQDSFGMMTHLNKLMSKRLGYEFNGFFPRRPGSDNFRKTKKVTRKLNNLNDAVNWISYLAKVVTKDLTSGCKCYGQSRGYQGWLKSTTNTRECLKDHSLMNESKPDHSVKTSVDYSIDKQEASQSNIESKGTNKLVDNPGIRSKFKINTSGWSKGFWCNYNKISQHYVDDNTKANEFIPINAISFPLLDEILAFFEETPEDARSHNEDSSCSMENELLANLEIREDNFQSKPKTKTKKCVPQDEYVIDIFSV